MKEINLVEEIEKRVINEAIVRIYDKWFEREDLINHLIYLETHNMPHEAKKLKAYFKQRFNEEL
jgi:hypothetical protein